MKKRRFGMAVSAALVLSLLVLAGHVKNSYFGSDTQNYCTAGQRQAQYCIMLYAPVCGWFDPETIQCFAYPCADTYSNSCFACMDENVLYWTAGECPK